MEHERKLPTVQKLPEENCREVRTTKEQDTEGVLPWYPSKPSKTGTSLLCVNTGHQLCRSIAYYSPSDL